VNRDNDRLAEEAAGGNRYRSNFSGNGGTRCRRTFTSFTWLRPLRTTTPTRRRKKGLKDNEELMVSDKEIDDMLPLTMRRASRALPAPIAWSC